MQNIRKIIFAIAFLAIAAGGLITAAVGGPKSTSLVGKWLGFPASKSGTNLTVEFRSDGTLLQGLVLMGNVAECRYHYVLKGGTLTETFIAGSINGKPIKVSDLGHVTDIYTYKLDGNTLLIKPSGPSTAIMLKRSDERHWLQELADRKKGGSLQD